MNALAVSPRTGTPGFPGDQDYIIRVIQVLEHDFGVRLFITPRDFDLLYRWWEKQIPLAVLSESLTQTISRRKKQGKGITGLGNFHYQVNKDFQAYRDRQINPDFSPEKKDPFTEIERFLARLPAELADFRAELELLLGELKSGKPADCGHFQNGLSKAFDRDPELEEKTRLFMSNLNPALRTPAIEKKYRWNYLLKKFNMPDFEIFVGLAYNTCTEGCER